MTASENGYNYEGHDAPSEPVESLDRMRDALHRSAAQRPPKRSPREILDLLTTRKAAMGTAPPVLPAPEEPSTSPWVEAITGAVEELLRNANGSAIREAVVVVRWAEEGYVDYVPARLPRTPSTRRIALMLDEAADDAVRLLGAP